MGKSMSFAQQIMTQIMSKNNGYESSEVVDQCEYFIELGAPRCCTACHVNRWNMSKGTYVDSVQKERQYLVCCMVQSWMIAQNFLVLMGSTV